ncbi:MAG: hypothetical protein JSR66_15155 [Proteobacteria bacterium]|nr:hypothetical protein [Pseudomonadota bacterium]
MPDVVIRISLLTRINIILGVLAVSFAPLLWTWRAIRNGEMDQQAWLSLVGQLALLQLLLWHAQKRCSSENLTFWHGVAVVAASIRTNWIYTDVLLALLVLPLMLTAAALLAFSSRPAYRFQRLVHGFYRNRMEQ